MDKTTKTNDECAEKMVALSRSHTEQQALNPLDTLADKQNIKTYTLKRNRGE